ncbi:hypothetical protein B296_00018670 [Ensete ventricosum]|uniref:Uncharacterized protein n=1 Tax=Ensete ventricosum TaxID=4639 RepID=A0A426YG57_ENSVE|nr:hypothetical protein B296_00018670 [Ensete ventricosum]
MDLGDLRGMPKMSSGKAPSTRVAAPAREVDVSPARKAPKTSSKRSIDAPTEQADDPARRHNKAKVLTRRHKSRHDEGESRSHSKDKKPAAPSEEPDTPSSQIERVEELDESLERLVGCRGVQEGTSPPSAGTGAIHAPVEARVRARKMDDELLQAMKALENARTELPKQAIIQYKESVDFKEGLKRMSRVTYEYGYQVALACFHA